MARVRWLAVTMVVAAALSACGGDDSGSESQSDESTTSASGEDPFCAEAQDIVGKGEVPDQDTIQELADNAPEEISDDFQLLADAMDSPQSADPRDVKEAQANIQSWGEEHCNTDGNSG